MPWDLTAVGTAVEVATSYDIRMTKRIAFSILCIMIWTCIVRKIDLLYRLRRYKIDNIRLKFGKRIITLAGTVLCLIISIYSNQFKNMNVYMWDTDIVDLYRSQGMVASFFKYAVSMRVKKPDNYSIEKLKNMSIECKDSVNEIDGIQPQNIIAIMNESFADMRVLNDGSFPIESYMPFWDSLKKNAISPANKCQ